MRSKTADLTWIVLSGCGFCLLYIWVARALQPGYAVKSLLRMLLFLGLPVFFWLVRKHLSLGEILRRILPQRGKLKGLLFALAAGLAIILAASLLVEPIIRFFGIGSIAEEIRNRTHTNRQRMTLGLLYIPIVNAFGEELFFRFFSVLELSDLGWRRLDLVLPAALFALYHLAILVNWFNAGYLALMLGSLFFCGLFLGWMVRRDRHVFGVWLLHGLVNVAIIAISLRFFQ